VNTGHLSALQSKHAKLEQKIERENGRLLPNDDLIHRLKKQKLHIKDALTHEISSA
jgi:hypothetical protein